tara:strand:- start:264 stop:533 length:270 start_codon:yes stop_codon:yes gene_type:complete
MKKEINRISTLPLAKVSALISLFIGIILALIGLVLLSGPEYLKMTAIIYLFAPIYMTFFGFLSAFLSAASYNFYAKKFGGIVVELRDAD